MESLKVGPELLRNIRAFVGRGCAECGGTGKAGRTGVFEVMPITSAIEAAILNKAPDTETSGAGPARRACATLREAAVEKMKAGFVTIEEVFAVTSA